MLRGRLTIRSIMSPRAGFSEYMQQGAAFNLKILKEKNLEKFERNRLTGKKQYYIILSAL